MNSQDELTRALAGHNPVPEQDVRAVTGRGHLDLSRAWTQADDRADSGEGGSVTDWTGRRARGPRRGGLTLLVAASVAGLVAASVLATGGLQDVQDRVAVAGMPDFPAPDRAAEAVEYDIWVQSFVECLSEEYAPWVEAVDGGYTYDGDGRVATIPANTSVSFDDTACREAAGPQPFQAPMTPDETRAYLDDLRDTSRCLQRLGHEVPEEPSVQDLYDQWQDELPDAPPWTPYLGVSDADVPAAMQECGLPSPASPPRWSSQYEAQLNQSPDAPVMAGQQAAAVRFLTPETATEVYVQCLTALGLPQEILPPGDGYAPTSTSDPQEARAADAVCYDRYPLHPLYERPLDRDQLAKLHGWYVEESVPCLEAQGVIVAAAPSEDVFIEAYPNTWMPYQSVDIGGLTVAGTNGAVLEGQAAWDQLQQTCPQGPPSDVLFPLAAGR